MKIIYICTYYHRAMIFRDAMNYLEKRGHSILAFNAALKGEPIAEKYAGIMDDKVIHSECYKEFDRYFFFRKQRKIYSSLINSIDVKQYDLVHSHFLFNGGWTAYRLYKKFGIPYVVSVRSGDLNEFLKFPFFVPIARRIVTSASGVLFLSGAYREQFIAKCFSGKADTIIRKSAVIPNGLEPFWLDNLGSPREIEDTKRIRLLSIGKINKNKNMKAVIEAAEILNSRGYQVTVTVIGQILDQEVEQYLKSKTMVTLVPYLTKEELISYYRDSDVFVLPSFKESFGRVYAEAMSQGLPVVYTKGQGFDGIFEDGYVGHSVNPCRSEEIADAIVDICRQYQTISTHCVNEARRFDWNEIAQQLEEFYNESIGQRQ